MTVGFFANTPRALVGSDCIATNSQTALTHFSPSSVADEFPRDEARMFPLVSKQLLLDDRTIVTFAGDFCQIRRYAEHLSTQWSTYDKSQRPMQFLHDIDQQIRAVDPGWSTSILGVYAGDDDGQLYFNTYSTPWSSRTLETNHMGTCHAIGSGAESVLRYLALLDSRLTVLGQWPKNTFFALLGALDGRVFFNYGDDKRVARWGGALQLRLFIPDKVLWARTPPWLHIHLFVDASGKCIGIDRKIVIHGSAAGTNYATLVKVIIYNGVSGGQVDYYWPIFSPLTQVSEINSLDPSKVMDTVRQVTVSMTKEGLGLAHHTAEYEYYQREDAIHVSDTIHINRDKVYEMSKMSLILPTT